MCWSRDEGEGVDAGMGEVEDEGEDEDVGEGVGAGVGDGVWRTVQPGFECVAVTESKIRWWRELGYYFFVNPEKMLTPHPRLPFGSIA